MKILPSTKRTYAFTLTTVAAALGAVNPGSAIAGGIILYEVGTEDVGLAAAGYAARAQDATTVFTNPAGMTRLDGQHLEIGAQVLYSNLKFSPGSGTSAALGTNDGGTANGYGGWFPGGRPDNRPRWRVTL